MEKPKITIPSEVLKEAALSYLPSEPPRTIDGKDISLEEIKKELFEHYGI